MPAIRNLDFFSLLLSCLSNTYFRTIIFVFDIVKLAGYECKSACDRLNVGQKIPKLHSVRKTPNF